MKMNSCNVFSGSNATAAEGSSFRQSAFPIQHGVANVQAFRERQAEKEGKY